MLGENGFVLGGVVGMGASPPPSSLRTISSVLAAFAAIHARRAKQELLRLPQEEHRQPRIGNGESVHYALFRIRLA